MSPIHFRVRYDGHTFVPLEPVNLPIGIVLDLWTKPIEESEPPRELGSAKGKVWMSEDFDDPLDDFKEYM